MQLPSLSIRKWIIRGAIIAPLLVLAAVFGGQEAERPRGDEDQLQANDTIVRPIFAIDNILGIEDVMNTVASSSSSSSKKKDEGAVGFVTAAVLPHHTLAADKLLELWTDIRATSRPSVIVLIGPNHENAGEGLVQTTHGIWTTPFGNVETDDALIDRLVSLGTVSDEPASFVNEHAIGTHAAYLAKLFPDTPILPIIAKSPSGADDALSLVLVMQQLLPDDALVISSVDFSHYLPQDTTDAMDAETLAHAAARRYVELERLHSDHLDSPFALIAYLLWNDRNGYSSDLIWQQTSHRLLGDPNAPGTSYLVFFSTQTSPTSLASPLTLSLTGDLMLGRGVASALSRTTIASAFADAAAVLAGSDVVFGNLESVLTNVEPHTNKEIYFKGDPQTGIAALKAMGFTQVSVSNNHVDDYNYAGWIDSAANLTASGIEPVGGFQNDGEAVVADGVVFLAFDDLVHRVDVENVSNVITNVAKQSTDTLVVSFHWGEEYEHEPTVRQTELAHAAIDAGADIVVGHHPHVLQGIETYNGGLILYSLGNFVFDQFGEDENETMVARVTIDGENRLLELIPMRIRDTFPRNSTDEERISTLSNVETWNGVDFPEGFEMDGKLSW